MADLDFSDLTDDQLVGLARALAAELRRRGSGVEAAAAAAVLDEAEKARIAQQAAEREAAAQRARERERIAAEAAARVRAEHAARQAAEEREREARLAEARAAEVAAKAQADAAEAIRREERRKAFVRRAAELVDLPPERVTLVVYQDGYPKRTTVHVNEGQDRYSREHLCSLRGGTIETRRRLMARKPALAQLCAELAATYADVAIVGADHFPQDQEAAARA